MAKHCTNCGHELRDTEKFCAECGTAVGGVAPQGQPTQWEYCEIVHQARQPEKWEWAGRSHPTYTDGKVYARAVHPKRGTYMAGEVRYDAINLGIEVHTAQQAVNILINKLTADEWELLPGRGAGRFSYKFRRPVKG